MEKLIGAGGYSKIFALGSDKVYKIIVLTPKRQKNKTLDSCDYNENPWREIYILTKCNEALQLKINR